MFRVVKTGKKVQKKGWKRVITKPTFVGPDFTRQNPKRERYVPCFWIAYKMVTYTASQVYPPAGSSC